jgi:pyruvate carboxylase
VYAKGLKHPVLTDSKPHRISSKNEKKKAPNKKVPTELQSKSNSVQNECELYAYNYFCLPYIDYTQLNKTTAQQII